MSAFSTSSSAMRASRSSRSASAAISAGLRFVLGGAGGGSRGPCDGVKSSTTVPSSASRGYEIAHGRKYSSISKGRL